MTFETHAAVAPLAEEWDELATRSGASPFLRPGWVEAWMKAFGNGRLELLALRREGRLAAILPLVRRGGSLRSPTNWHTPEFGPVAEDEHAARELAREALGGRAKWADLGFLTEGAPATEALRDAAHERGMSTLERTLLRSPYIPIEGDWESYVATLDSKRMREVRRRHRKLEAEGEVSYDVRDGTGALDESLEEGLRLEAAGWKGRRGTAILSHPDTHRFYRDIARWAADRGWLRLEFLRLDGRALAFDLTLEVDGVAYLLKRGFDPEFSRFGPGTLLTHEVLRRLWAQATRSYELLGDADPHKLMWTDHIRERILLQAFGRSPAGLAAHAAYRHGRPLAKRLRDATRARLRREGAERGG